MSKTSVKINLLEVVIIKRFRFLLLSAFIIGIAGCSGIGKQDLISHMLSSQEGSYYLAIFGASEQDLSEFQAAYQNNSVKITGYIAEEEPGEQLKRELNIVRKPTYIVFDTESEVFRTNDLTTLKEFLEFRPDAREVAWEFLKEEGWDHTATGDWKSAVVENTIADESYELLDQSYVGKLVLSVSFEDQQNVVVGTPEVLLDFDTHEVIGYIAGE